MSAPRQGGGRRRTPARRTSETALALRGGVTGLVPQARPGLQASADALHAGALELPALRQKLGAPDLSEDEDRALDPKVDPRIDVRAQVLQMILQSAPAQAGTVASGGAGTSADAGSFAGGVTADEVGALLDQLTEMGEGCLTALSLQRAVRDSRRVLGRSLRTFVGQILVAADARVAALPEDSEERAQLAEDLGALRDRDAAYRAQLADKGARSRAEDMDNAATLQSLDRRGHLSEVLLAIRAGRRVPKAEASAAAATLASLEAEAAPVPASPDRRDLSR